jgi:putative oxidoreductase
MFTTFCKNAIVPALLRLALATIFIYHGLGKVGGEGTQWGAHWITSEGAPAAPIQLAVAWGELIGGIALALGFLTRAAAIGIIIIMIGAIANVHGQHGFSLAKGGYEYNFAIIAMALCLVLSGPGPFAVDRFFRFKARTP